MRSQSLFNFFTKAADVQTTSAGTRIVTGKDAKKLRAQTAARGNAVYNAEQKRRSGMTDQQRWTENWNNHLSDQAGAGKDQYNLAWDNHQKDLADAVARGEITQQQADEYGNHTLRGIKGDQQAFVKDYLTSYDNGDHTDSDIQGIRGTKIRTTHGDNGLVHFRHGDLGENTTFGGAERGYAQRAARAAAGGGRGGAGAARSVRQKAAAGVRGGMTGASAGVRGGAHASARGGAPQMTNNRVQARPNDASLAYDMQYGPKQQPTQAKPQTPAASGTPANASNVTPTTPPSPITFKGGYTVGGVSGDIDWAAKGDGSINVGGAQLTADQYNAFNNVRSSLATQLRQQEGLSHTEARARATQMANQWMADQTAVANGGKAQNRWQHVENPQPAAPAPAQPAPAPTPESAPAPAAMPVSEPTDEVKPLARFDTSQKAPVPQQGAPADTAADAATQQGASTAQGDQAQNANTQQAANKPVTWDLEAGKKDPRGYIKHYTQALDADTIQGWNKKGWNTKDGKLTAKGYFEGMAGRHHSNMTKLEELARNGNWTDNERDEIMKALNAEAARFNYYKRQHEYYNSWDVYKPAIHGPVSYHIARLENKIAKGPVEFGWMNGYYLPDTIKDYSNGHFFK